MTSPVKLDLPHVTSRENADGKVRYYFRRRGQPVTRLPDDPLSDEFRERYEALKTAATVTKAGYEGSFRWLCDRYMDAPAFTTKAKATREARKRIILQMVDEPIKRGKPSLFGDERAVKFNPTHIEVLRDRKADNPNAANERLKILRQIFKFGIPKKYVRVNVARDVEPLPVPRGGHDTATDEHIAKYLEHHKSGPARLAMLILKHTGVRVSDLRILGRQHMKKGVLTFKTVKTGVLCELPVDDELAAALPRDNMTFLLSEAKQPYESDKALSQRVAKWFRQAGIEGITAHSVRKWRATKMAENGATEYQLVASFGWSDPKEARPYVQAASRKRLAGEAAKLVNV